MHFSKLMKPIAPLALLILPFATAQADDSDPNVATIIRKAGNSLGGEFSTVTSTITALATLPKNWSPPADCSSLTATYTLTNTVWNIAVYAYYEEQVYQYENHCAPGRPSCCPPGWKADGFYNGALPGGYEVKEIGALAPPGNIIAVPGPTVSTPYRVNGGRTEVGKFACPVIKSTATGNPEETLTEIDYLVWSSTTVGSEVQLTPYCGHRVVLTSSWQTTNSVITGQAVKQITSDINAPAMIIFDAIITAGTTTGSGSSKATSTSGTSGGAKQTAGAEGDEGEEEESGLPPSEPGLSQQQIIGISVGIGIPVLLGVIALSFWITRKVPIGSNPDQSVGRKFEG